MRSVILLGLFALVFACMDSSALLFAETKEPISCVLAAQKVQISKDGKEQLTSAERAKPGDVLQYVATYTNTSDRTVRDLQATLPIPRGLALKIDSPDPKKLLASTDGTKFDTFPLKRKIKGKDGKEKIVPVPASEYRYLRWTCPELPAGKSVSMTARVVVITAMDARAE